MNTQIFLKNHSTCYKKVAESEPHFFEYFANKFAIYGIGVDINQDNDIVIDPPYNEDYCIVNVSELHILGDIVPNVEYILQSYIFHDMGDYIDCGEMLLYSKKYVGNPTKHLIYLQDFEKECVSTGKEVPSNLYDDADPWSAIICSEIVIPYDDAIKLEKKKTECTNDVVFQKIYRKCLGDNI